MQLNLYLLLSIWLLAVAALPTLDPRLWKTYGVYNTFTSPDPPFPPPDIGPLDLPEDYFNDYPDLTENQITLIRQENMKNHKRHVRFSPLRTLTLGDIKRELKSRSANNAS